MRRAKLFLPGVFSVLVLVATSMPAVPTVPQAKSAEPVVVNNPKDPVPPPGTRSRLELTEELTIGAAEGDENLMFGETVFVAADDTGCVYVVDFDRKRIQKFAPDGKFLMSLGRAGQGPGEFQSISQVRFDAHGGLYCSDVLNKRLAFFDPDGRFVKTVAFPAGVIQAEFLPGGNILAQTNAVEPPKITTMTAILDPRWKSVAELHRDVFDIPSGAPTDPAKFIAAAFAGAAFKPAYAVAVRPDGRVCGGFPERYEIRVHDEAGACRSVIRKAAPSRPVERRHIEYLFERSVRPALKMIGMESIADTVKNGLSVSRPLPAFGRIVAMDNGWLLVVEDEDAEGCAADLFDGGGVYVGRFRAALDSQTLVFRKGKAYAVADVDGFKFVKRYGYKIVNY